MYIIVILNITMSSAIAIINKSGLTKAEKDALKSLMAAKSTIKSQIEEDTDLDDNTLKAYLNQSRKFHIFSI